MKKVINNKIRKIVEAGDYISSFNYETLEMLQSRMKKTDYNYYVTTADNNIHFISKDKTFEMQLKDFDWRILWDKLHNIPVNDNEEIEQSFEHFENGTDTIDIWHWFEWFFDITLGKEIFK